MRSGAECHRLGHGDIPVRSIGPLIVLLAIAHEADRDGIATMSLQELTRKTRLAERTVRIGVRDLVTLGELDVTTGSGRGRRSGYRVTAAGTQRWQNLPPLRV